ncbi:MAG: hypothetical protein ACI96L_000539 [Paracoccaceae bacterium]
MFYLLYLLHFCHSACIPWASCNKGILKCMEYEPTLGAGLTQ